MKWKALKIASGKEIEVVRELERMGVESYAPKYNMYERRHGRPICKERYLLPGYILIHVELTAELYYKLDAIWYVLYLLSGIVEESEINYLRELETVRESIIDYTGEYIRYIGPIAKEPERICKVDKRKGRVLIKIALNGETVKRWVPVRIIK